jgi:hypothetical protein
MSKVSKRRTAKNKTAKPYVHGNREVMVELIRRMCKAWTLASDRRGLPEPVGRFRWSHLEAKDLLPASPDVFGAPKVPAILSGTEAGSRDYWPAPFKPVQFQG